MYIDTHCHLSRNDYENIEKVIEDAKQANIKKLIISGCDKKGIEESLEIARLQEEVYLALGYHPSEADIVTEEDLKELKEIIKSIKKVVAVGEIGLDYHWNKENKEEQKKLFKKQIEIAKELALPVVIHSRDAFQDTYDILKSSKVTGVIHCFSGNVENAKMYIELGFTLGIGGVITFHNTHLKEVIKEISLQNIVLETDCPYLAPVPYRGQKNEPKYIPVIAEEISKLKQNSLSEVEQSTTKNAKKIWNIQ